MRWHICKVLLWVHVVQLLREELLLLLLRMRVASMEGGVRLLHFQCM